jgi:hypothetical protein
VVFFGQDTGFDDVAERAGLFQLGNAFLQRTGLPEGRQSIDRLRSWPGPTSGEEHEERTERENRHDGNGGLGDQAALFQGFLEAELVLGAAPAAAAECQ